MRDEACYGTFLRELGERFVVKKIPRKKLPSDALGALNENIEVLQCKLRKAPRPAPPS